MAVLILFLSTDSVISDSKPKIQLTLERNRGPVNGILDFVFVQQVPSGKAVLTHSKLVKMSALVSKFSFNIQFNLSYHFYSWSHEQFVSRG